MASVIKNGKLWLGIAMMGVVGVMSGGPAGAIEHPRPEKTMLYQQAIEANNKCVAESTQAQEDKAAELGWKAGSGNYLVGDLLSGVNAARGETRVVRYSMGCKDPYVVERLNFYGANIR